MGRATQGVKIINLKKNDEIASVAKVPAAEEEENEEGLEGLENNADGSENLGQDPDSTENEDSAETEDW